VGDTEAYDQIKVDAILNQIDGSTRQARSASARWQIFGMTSRR